MLDNPFQIVTGVVLLTVIGIAYGGTFLLRVVRGAVPPTTCRGRSSGPATPTPGCWSSSAW